MGSGTVGIVIVWDSTLRSANNAVLNDIVADGRHFSRRNSAEIRTKAQMMTPDRT